MQFVTVRLGRAKRAYTYHNEGEPVDAGAVVKVPPKSGDGWQRGTVVDVNVPRPEFATKPILGLVDGEDAPAGLPGLGAQTSPAAETSAKPEPAPPAAGHNRPPVVDQERVDSLRDRLRKLADEAGGWAEKETIEDQTTAEQVADTFNGLRKLEREAEAQRKIDKEPHLAAGRQVDATYAGIKAAAEKAIKKIGKMLDAWAELKAEQQRKAKAEAEAAARRQAEEAERQAEAATVRHDAVGEAEAEQRAKDAQKALKEAARTKTTGQIGSATGGGRTLSQRTFWEAEIENPRRAFLALFDDYPSEFTAELKRLAEDKMRHTPAAEKDAMTVPGVKFHKRRAIQ